MNRGIEPSTQPRHRHRRPLNAALSALLGCSVIVSGGSTPATGAGAPSVVNDGLMVHWDASEASSLRDASGGSIDDGEAIGSWIDLASGVTAAAVTSVGGVQRPVYRATGGPGGTPVVEFDAGSSQGLETAAMPLFATPSSGLTVIAVFETDQVSPQNFLVMHDTGNCLTNVEIGLATGLNAPGNWGVHRGCSDADVTPGGTIATGAPYIVVTTLATTGSTPNHVAHRVNGVGVANLTNASGFTPAGSYSTAPARLRIGFRQEAASAANSFFDGRVSELMIFDRALSASRLGEIEHQLATKRFIATFPPVAPASLSVTPDATTAAISWTAPANGGSAILGYDVTVSATAGTVATCSVSAGTTSCGVSGLGSATLHQVTVTATNALGTGTGAATTFTTASPPGAPTSLSITPGVTTAAIGWTAPANGGSAILGYDVTVSATAGTVATCSVSAGTTSCGVSGLGSATLHQVTVTATNAAGTGTGATMTFTTASPVVVSTPTSIPPPPPSPNEPATTDPSTGPSEGGSPPETTSPTTISPPTSDPVPPESIAEPEAGFVVAAEDGARIGVTLEQLAATAWRITGAEFALEIAARDGLGGDTFATTPGVANLVVGGSIETSGRGFAPNSAIDVWLFSEPRRIGRAAVDATGGFRAAFAVPGDLIVGDHHLQVQGVNPDGLIRAISLGVKVHATPASAPPVAEVPATGRLPDTGAVPIGKMMVALIVIASGLGVRRLRRGLA